MDPNETNANSAPESDVTASQDASGQVAIYVEVLCEDTQCQ
jgi:hypothetical protein